MLRRARIAAALATTNTHIVVSAQPAGAAPADDKFGCPSGWVCIYRDAGPDHLNASGITYKWSTYGPHNLTNQFGEHWVVNNQYGGRNAIAVLMTGYNGTGTVYGTASPEGGAYGYDLTTVNSIVLNRP